MEVNPAKLRELRAERGLAKEAEVSTETVYSIEHGKHQPSMKTLGKISQELEVDPTDLLARDH